MRRAPYLAAERRVCCMLKLAPCLGAVSSGVVHCNYCAPVRAHPQACAKARQIPLAPTPEEQQRLEQAACALFFRVAAVFAPGPSQAAFPGQAAAVARCAQLLLADLSGAGGEGEQAESPEVGSWLVYLVVRWLLGRLASYLAFALLPVAARENPDRPLSGKRATRTALSAPLLLQAAELQYYEALMTMFERLGRHSAAARCALAAARQVRIGWVMATNLLLCLGRAKAPQGRLVCWRGVVPRGPKRT